MISGLVGLRRIGGWIVVVWRNLRVRGSLADQGRRLAGGW
jgi:hypothetical protein